MASFVVSQLTSALSFLRDHPKHLACVLLLLLSSPLYRILLYFTPLLLSTALCIFALITLTPYVTATDAEVERQSSLGASSQQQLKKKTVTATTAAIVTKDRELGDGSGYYKPSSSSDAGLAPASTSLPASSPVALSISGSETSWFSWMKGLNDIGRTWMENKLTEQGLNLSEPANRETLLAFIEGSFADLMTAQGNPSSDQIFAAMENSEDALTAVEETVPPLEKSGGALKARPSSECVGEEGLVLQRSVEDEEVLRAKVSSSSVVDDRALMESVKGETNATTVNQVAVQAPSAVTDACAVTEHLHTSKSVPESSKPSDDDVKMQENKLPGAHDSVFEVVDGISDTRAATIMPRTPSRVPAPSKLFEVSRKFFAKEEQSKSMVPTAPLQTLATARANQSFKSAFGSPGPRKLESSPGLFKLPARKFLERSRSIPSKELGGKLNTSSTALGSLAGSKVGQRKMKENTASNEALIVARRDGIKDELHVDDADDVMSGPDDNGPRFDEDLEVEEAQALVQSELKMLEVELDEVAAKLPKLDGTFMYQRTPVSSIKSVALPVTPAGTPTKCTIALFSASPTLKT